VHDLDNPDVAWNYAIAIASNTAIPAAVPNWIAADFGGDLSANGNGISDSKWTLTKRAIWEVIARDSNSIRSDKKRAVHATAALIAGRSIPSTGSISIDGIAAAVAANDAAANDDAAAAAQQVADTNGPLPADAGIGIEAGAAFVAGSICPTAKRLAELLCEFIGGFDASDAEKIAALSEEQQGLYAGFMDLSAAYIIDGYRAIKGSYSNDRFDRVYDQRGGVDVEIINPIFRALSTVSLPSLLNAADSAPSNTAEQQKLAAAIYLVNGVLSNYLSTRNFGADKNVRMILGVTARSDLGTDDVVTIKSIFHAIWTGRGNTNDDLVDVMYNAVAGENVIVDSNSSARNTLEWGLFKGLSRAFIADKRHYYLCQNSPAKYYEKAWEKTSIYKWSLEAIGTVSDDPEKQQLFAYVAYVAKEMVEVDMTQQNPPQNPRQTPAASHVTAPRIQATPQNSTQRLSRTPAATTTATAPKFQTSAMNQRKLVSQLPWMQKRK
jgi:hypothetical protein